MGNYIDDAGGGGERQSDSFLGNPDTIFHGENDPFTQQLDARMIAKLTPEERLKMGAELPEKLEARVAAALNKAERDLYAARKASAPQEDLSRVPRWLAPILVILAILMFAALAALLTPSRAEWGKYFGNSPEIPVKSPIPAPSPAPTHP